MDYKFAEDHIRKFVDLKNKPVSTPRVRLVLLFSAFLSIFSSFSNVWQKVIFSKIVDLDLQNIIGKKLFNFLLIWQKTAISTRPDVETARPYIETSTNCN
jgi:hypothetical protein